VCTPGATAGRQAEQIQRAFPAARGGQVAQHHERPPDDRPRRPRRRRHQRLSLGDDPGAKQTVTDLLHRFGRRDVIDLGGLSTARGTEMVLPMWVRPWQALGTAHFTIAVVR
jgi:hypothetical protein